MKKLSWALPLFAALLALPPLLAVTGCASSPPAFSNAELTDRPVAEAGDMLESGRILFTEKPSLPEKLFSGKKQVAAPTPEANDLTITGRRTASSKPEKTKSDSKLIQVLDAVLKEDLWRYEWQGTLTTDGVEIPLSVSMAVPNTGSFSDEKEYRLKNAYSRSHAKALGLKEKLKHLVGADTETRLSMETYIDSRAREVPFKIASFTTKEGDEYAIFVSRGLVLSPDAKSPGQSTRSLVFARAQRYQVTDSTGKTVYADCTLDGYRLYRAAVQAGAEAGADGRAGDRRAALKEGIGLFTAWLWSLEEHERHGGMLE